MASIIQVGNSIRAQIRRSGQPALTKSFPLKDYKTPAEAERVAAAWIVTQEADFLKGKQVGVHGKTGLLISDAIDRYLKENKKLSKTAVDIMGYLKVGLGKIRLDKITKADIVKYIQDKNFGPMSGAMHFSFLRTVLITAKTVWEYHVPDILADTAVTLSARKLVGSSKERTRRPTENEIQLLLNHKFPTPMPMNDIIRFAMSSAMRQAEITRIEHKTFNEKDRVIVITDRKHPKKKIGNHQSVPLLDESIAIIKRQERKEGDDRVFPFLPRTVGQYFTQACKALGIVDLRFHDLRHEAASRLFEMGYQIHEVAMFTGHEDWKMLERYTHLKAKDVRRLQPKEEKKEAPVVNGVVMDAETAKQFAQFQAMLAMMKQAQPA